MFELIIKYVNGNVYWIEYFNSLESLQKWLATEQTRPYWQSDFMTEVVDHTPPPPTEEETAATSARQAQLAIIKTRVKALAAQNDLTPEELKEAVMNVLRLMDDRAMFDG